MPDNSVILGQIESLNKILETQKGIMDNAQALMVDLDRFISEAKAARDSVPPGKKKDGERDFYDKKIGQLNYDKQVQINRYNAAKSAYEDALAKLETAKKNLTSTEQQAVSSEADLKQAELNLTEKLSEAALAKTTQGTTIYLIWGAVALLFIIFLGLILYKKYAA